VEKRLAEQSDSARLQLARMQKLVDGIHSFQTGFFADNRALFRRLSDSGQEPETLFITCSDSRVVPNLITNSPPGELFIIRNVGNIVPHPDLPGGTAAAIEYAVQVLNVQNIIVCGHTQCGALQAVLDPSSIAHLKYVQRWVKQSERVRGIITERYSHLDPDARLTAAVQENVLVQLETLREYDFIASRLDSGKLRLSGWVFRLSTAEVFNFDPKIGEFVSLNTPTD